MEHCIGSRLHLRIGQEATKATAIMLMAGVGMYSQSTAMAPDRSAIVCTEGEAAGFGEICPAQMLASKMFGQIGVTIEWRRNRRDCPAGSILILLRVNTPITLNPGALAYALPYEGTHIQVFYDRISENLAPPMVSILLGHVLVHEIAHILEGCTRHSDRGVMKANWDRVDLVLMRCGALGFTAEDIDLIYRGLAARKRRGLRQLELSPASEMKAALPR